MKNTSVTQPGRQDDVLGRKEKENWGEWVDDFRTFSRDNPDRSWIEVLAA